MTTDLIWLAGSLAAIYGPWLLSHETPTTKELPRAESIGCDFDD